MEALEDLYAQDPNILSYASFIFAGSATNFVTMQPWGKRHETTQEVISKLMPAINRLPVLIDFSVSDPVDYGIGSDGKSVQIHVMTLGDYYTLSNTVQSLMAVFNKYPGMQNVTTNLHFDNQVYNLSFRRDAAASLGVNLQDIADTVSTMLGGKHTTDVQKDNQTYQVLVQMDLKDLSSFKGFNSIYVRNNNNEMIPLSNLVTLKPAVSVPNYGATTPHSGPVIASVQLKSNTVITVTPRKNPW